MPTQPSPMPQLGVGQRHQRPAAGVAEQHDGLGAPARISSYGRLHVDDALLVQAVGVVAHVAGAEAEHRVAGGGQQRAGVVDGEVATRVARMTAVFHTPAGRQPQQPPHERAVRAHEPDGLPR